MAKTIQDRVESFFSSSPTPEMSRHFLDRLEQQADYSARLAVRRLSLMLVTWLVMFGISAGVIEEGSLSGFQVAKLNPLLALGPVRVATGRRRGPGSRLLLLSALDPRLDLGAPTTGRQSHRPRSVRSTIGPGGG